MERVFSQGGECRREGILWLQLRSLFGFLYQSGVRGAVASSASTVDSCSYEENHTYGDSPRAYTRSGVHTEEHTDAGTGVRTLQQELLALPRKRAVAPQQLHFEDDTAGEEQDAEVPLRAGRRRTGGEFQRADSESGLCLSGRPPPSRTPCSPYQRDTSFYAAMAPPLASLRADAGPDADCSLSENALVADVPQGAPFGAVLAAAGAGAAAAVLAPKRHHSSGDCARGSAELRRLSRLSGPRSSVGRRCSGGSSRRNSREARSRRASFERRVSGDASELSSGNLSVDVSAGGGWFAGPVRRCESAGEAARRRDPWGPTGAARVVSPTAAALDALARGPAAVVLREASGDSSEWSSTDLKARVQLWQGVGLC